MKNIKILLGKENDQEKYWLPSEERNPHLVLIGGSGSGKTETLKSICFELKKQEVPSLIIDFHDDFSVFAENLVSLENSTIHPLEIQIGEKPIDVVYKIAKIFANIFKFGEIQEATLRDAIKSFYAKSGIIDLKKPQETQTPLQEFSLFKNILEEEFSSNRTIQSILSKLQIVFDTDLFMNAKSTALPFDSMINKISVIKLNDYPTDEIKATIAEIILRNLINQFYLKGKTEDGIKLFCIIDEAHRVTYEGSPVDILLRESRKYGVGMILASQRPTDFSETTMGNVATIITFQCSLAKDARNLSNTLGIDPTIIQKLAGPGNCYIKLASEHTPFKLRITRAKDRPGIKKLLEEFDENERKKLSEKEIQEIKERNRKIEEYEKLKKEFPKLKEMLEKTKQELTKTEKNYNLTKNQLKEMEKIINEKEKLEENLDEQIEKNIILNEQIIEYKNQLKEMKKIINEKEKIKEELDNEIKKNNDLNEKLNILKSEIKQIKLVVIEKEELDKKYEKINKKNKELNQEVLEKDEKIKKMSVDFKKEFNKLIEELKEEKEVSKEAFNEIKKIEEKANNNIILKKMLGDIFK